MMKKLLLIFAWAFLVYQQAFSQCEVNIQHLQEMQSCGNTAISLFAFPSGTEEVEWITSGTGTFTNHLESTTDYIPSSADIEGGTVLLTVTTKGCTTNVSNTTTVQLIKPDVVDAGPDQVVCEDATSITLNGMVNNSPGGMWEGGSGSVQNMGTYSIYTLSPSDIASGLVFLTLTSPLSEPCPQVSDQLLITIKKKPDISAGQDMNICSTDLIELYAHNVDTVAATWTTSGSGTFIDASSMKTTYTPSSSDIENGSVTLTYSSDPSACASVSDALTAFIFASPTVDAGPNQQLKQEPIALSPTVTNGSYYYWNTSGSGTFSDSMALKPSYTPGPSDTSLVILKLTVYGEFEFCPSVSDELVLTNNDVVCNVSINYELENNELFVKASNTDDVNIGSYSWSFGDDTYRSGKTQQHTYTHPGTYDVEVHFVTHDTTCIAKDKISITITDIKESVYSITGQVKAGTNDLDYGEVWLFKLNNVTNHYDLLRSEIVEHNGYNFGNVSNGTYLVYATLDSSSEYKDNYLPSYYGGATTWTEAQKLIVSDMDISSANIELISYVVTDVVWNTGEDVIEGTVTFDQSVTLRTTGASANAVEGATVILQNKKGEILTTTKTNTYGKYKFTGVAKGDYTVKVEYAGVDVAATASTVEVDGDPATTSEASVAVFKQAVTTSLFSSSAPKSGLKLYPNPVADHLSLQLSGNLNQNAKVRIYNTTGSLMFEEQSYAANELMISTSSLDAGFYIIEVIANDQVFKERFCKK